MLNSISDLVRKYLVPYRRSGSDEIRATCPFCNGGDSGDTETFSLNIDTGYYYCYRGSCRAGGNIAQLAAHFGETIKGSQVNMNLKTQVTYKYPDVQLFPRTPQINDYFHKRAISASTLDAYSISADEHGNIVFPFYEGGDLTYVKFRKPKKPEKKEPKEWQLSETKPILFGMHLCDRSYPLIITEGEIDALSLFEAGAKNVVSVPSGCDNTKWVELCWDWLEGFDSIILFGDNDPPGRQMVNNLIKRLGESRCRIVEEYPLTPSGIVCKDANDILVQLGDMILMDILESAEDIPTRGLIDLATVIPEDPTTIPRIKTNIPALDETIGGLREGAITVLTGRSGAGKSTLAGLFLLNAIEQGHTVCAYSGELNVSEFQNWINLQAAGSDYITLKYDPIKDKQIPIVPPNVAQAIQQWYRGKLLLYDNNEIFESNQAESIISVFTMAVRRYNCKTFVIDNLMMCTSDTDEETRAQGKFMNALKRFVNKYRVHVVVVAHGRKLAAGRTTLGQDDISGNSATVKLAHSAIVAETPNLRVIKSRESGQNRLIECCYCPDSHRIYQKDKGDLNHFSWNDGSIPQPKKKACDLDEYAVKVGQSPTSDQAPF